MRPRYPMLVGVIACALLLLGNDVITVREDHQSQTPKRSEQQFPRPDEPEAIQGYPVRQRRIGGPTDVEQDLDNSFPKRGSFLELFLRCPESQRP